MKKKRVLVEIRVPKALAERDVFDFVRNQIRLAEFELDTSYAPVPSAPLEEIAADLDEAGEHLLTLRGTLPPNSQTALETQPGVVAVWSDAEVEPFDAP
jgi:hypothetical protein